MSYGHRQFVGPSRSEARKRERSRRVSEAGARAREPGSDDADLVRAASRTVDVRRVRRLPRRTGASESPERPDRQGADGAGAAPAGLAAGDRTGGGARREARRLIAPRYDVVLRLRLGHGPRAPA